MTPTVTALAIDAVATIPITAFPAAVDKNDIFLAVPAAFTAVEAAVFPAPYVLFAILFLHSLNKSWVDGSAADTNISFFNRYNSNGIGATL